MAFEKRWAAVPPQSLTTNGTADGTFRVVDASHFFVKQLVILTSGAQPALNLQIKRIELNLIYVGHAGQDIRERADVSAYLVADGAALSALEQPRVTITPEEGLRAVFQEEPAVAFRTILVDESGDVRDSSNPSSSLTTFLRNGEPVPVSEDTVTPANNVPLPVKLTGFQGDVAIEATNLNLDVQTEGQYDLSTNPMPDSIGVIAHGRGLTQDRTKQTQRTTAQRGSSDTDTVSLDVSIHDHFGNQFTESNPVPVSDASTHDKLDTLHSDVVVVEGKQDVGNASLASIDSKLSTTNSELGTIDSDLNTFATQNHTDLGVLHSDSVTIEGKLDTLHADLVVVEGKQDTGNTSLASIDSKLTTTNSELSTIDSDLNTFASQNHFDLTSIKSDIDSTNTKLDTLHADNVVIEGKLDTLHSDNVVIEGKLDTIHSDLVAVEGKQDTGNASLASIDSKLTTTNIEIGALTETAPATDTASSGLNGRLQRVAQRLTTVDSDLNTFASQTHTDLGVLHSDNVVIEGKLDTIHTDLSGIATTQTNGTQKAQTVDAVGNVQPAGDVAARGIFSKITDGTNTQAVKAASTPAAASDPSAVVALSPNSPLPAGTNAIGTVKAQLQDNAGTAITLGQKTMASSIPVAIASDQSHFPVELQDGAGNNITSQTNGAQRALDVGVNVAGVQVDPRQIGVAETTAPSTKTTGTVTQITTDEYGRIPTVYQEATEAQWGQMFTATTNVQALTGTTEVAFLYITNPNGSGKTAKFQSFQFNSQITSNSSCIYRLYKDPTVTANGTTVVITGMRQTGQNATVISMFTGPTVTSNGTFLRTAVSVFGTAFEDEFNFSLWLEPNHSYLITRQLSTNSTVGGVNLSWAEQ